MRWFKIRIGTTKTNEDVISSAMYRGGFGGAVVEDHAGLTESEKKRMFVDILPEQQEDDGQAFLDFYAQITEEGLLDPAGTVYDDMAGTASAVNLDRDRKPVLYNEEELLKRVREIMDGIPGAHGYTLETETIEDENWAESWKDNFHSFTVGRIRIAPPWEVSHGEDTDQSQADAGENNNSAEGETEVIIDPGDAFGTGTHETTMLCLEALQEYSESHLKGGRVLDAGTGSGILAISALKLGADYAAGTDLDPCAIRAVEENAELNDIDAHSYLVRKGDLTKDRKLVADLLNDGAYDLITANIIAEVIAPMVGVLAEMLRTGGILITSGILNEKADMIAGRCRECGLTVLSVRQKGEWTCMVATKE